VSARKIRAVLITISTSRSDGDHDDPSGERLATLAAGLEATVEGRELIPDDRELIAERLRHWADEGGADLILTSGGTGFSPDDQTPEATSAVIERRAPGLAEAIRQEAARHTKHWALSRGIAGIRGSCLIINLPGSPAGVEEAAPVLLPILPHALDLIAGRPAGH
jgi:molybdenum cofactor synthesis domain-containing protein